MKNVFVALLLVLLAVPAQANDLLVFPAVDEEDAAEERVSTGAIDLTSSDLEIVVENPGDASRTQVVGIRFPAVNIDQNTEIVGAYIQFTVDETKGSGTDLNVTIRGEASLNPAQFNASTYNISSRDTTTASAVWTGAPDWDEVGVAGPAQQTADLTAIVQELVAQPGWTAGNAMAFIIEGSGTRCAESISSSGEGNPELVIVTPTTSAFPIAEEGDDMEEYVSDGSKDIGSSDLEIVEEGGPADLQRVGLRFQNILIEPGATILEAYVRFDVDETDIPGDNRNPFNVTITGEDTGNSAAFSAATPFDVRDRVTNGNGTDATVTWTLGVEGDDQFWTVTHTKQFTPDLSAIIQEIIDRPDWKGGNALTLVLGSDTDSGERTAESFEGAGSNTDRIPTLFIKFDGDSAPPPKEPSTEKYRIMFNDDPATTMAIAWNQLNGENPVVKWGLRANVADPEDPDAYANETAPYREISKLGMETKIVKLTGLQPDSEYAFLIVDSNNQSRSMWFKTAPAVQQPIAYISGGDTKSSGTSLTQGQITNTMVPKLRPLFVFFTGDFCSGSGTSPDQWDIWLNDWSEQTVAEDGQMFPILAVHGNHEDGDFAVLHDLFDTPVNTNGVARDMYALSFAGKLLRVYSLNSQLYNVNNPQASLDAQAAWLATDLAAASTDHTFTVAGYHKPVRPHTSGKRENWDRLGPLAQIFADYGLSISTDGDSHMNKVTFPIVPCDNSEPGCFQNYKRDDVLGTIYVGEGSWGAGPRASDDDKPWTIKSGSHNQFKWIHVYPDNPITPEDESIMEIRTVNTVKNGQNLVAGVASNPAGDSFTIPAGIDLETYGPLGTVVTYPFQAPVGTLPVPPTNFMGTALSYNDVQLSWNGVDASDVTRLEIEQLVGNDWVAVSTSIDPTTFTYEIDNLPDNSTFTYRLRAINFFGQSEWVEASVTTPDDPRLIGRFQQGVNGYMGASDSEIREETKETGFPSIGDTVSVDRNENGQGDARWVLLKFEDIFGDPKDGLIPAGAIILEATLSFDVTSSTGGGTVFFNRMPFAWDDLTSWNDLVDQGMPIEDNTIGDGIFNAGTEDGSFQGASSGQIKVVDITASLEAWSANPASNFGWLITNSSTDGWDWTQSDGGTPNEHPLLTVFFEMPGDQDNDGDIDRADCMIVRGFLNQPANDELCPGCDLDNDGTITVLDYRKLTRSCTRSRCAE